MCTVTFLPLGSKDFILTSNRDEQRSRETFPPLKYEEQEVAMYFPKDKTAGGTWIGTSDRNRLVCVLNGAFIKHKRKAFYRKSRGVISKELLKAKDMEIFLNEVDLSDIEPFTMVILDWNKHQLQLVELIWDEHKKYVNYLDNDRAVIWSSSTLYTDEAKTLRKTWFRKWLDENEFSSENILAFHHSEYGDKDQSVLMKRPYVETVSITSVEKKDKKIAMKYEDVIHSKKAGLHYHQNS